MYIRYGKYVKQKMDIIRNRRSKLQLFRGYMGADHSWSRRVRWSVENRRLAATDIGPVHAPHGACATLPARRLR
jgi:hypothetical protein